MSTLKVLNKGENTAKVAFLVVAVIGIIKGVIGYISGSVSLMAQATDSASDLLSMLAVIVGFRLSKRNPSDKFPYGYYRMETLASLIVSLIIVLTGSKILLDSFARVIHPQPLTSPLQAIAVAAVSIPILIILSRNTGRIGEEINSKSLVSQAEDFKVDVYSSIFVLIGVVGSYFGFDFIDGVAGIIISLLVLKVGLFFGWDAILVLVDAVTDVERLDQLKSTALDVSGVLDVERVRIRRSGPFCMGQLNLVLDEKLNIEDAHRISENVERQVKERFPEVESLQIQIEPKRRRKLRVGIPVIDDGGMDSRISPDFSEAPYILIVDIDDGRVVRWVTLPNPGVSLERKRGIATSHLLIDEKITTLLVMHIGEGPYHMLNGAYINLYHLPEIIVAAEALRKHNSADLKMLNAPSQNPLH